LDAQKKIIEKQRDNILDSIQYAGYIQQSVLRTQEEVLKKFPFQTFIFFRPRDVVSGDFYWFGNPDNLCILISADCTGHGVPGALLSMIGSSLLNEIIYENKITVPAKILWQLDKLFVKTLGQHTEGARAEDGIDMSACTIDVQKKVLSFAGAMNPLYIVRNGNMEVLHAASICIGGKKQNTEEQFANHELTLENGISIYMASDGYMDQISSENKRRIGSKKFRELLVEISKYSFPEQEKLLHEFITSWQGIRKQMDDILIIGAKF